MPHLMLEYTDNLGEAFNPRLTLFKLHKSLINAHLCEADELKSRAIRVHDHLIGDGSREQGFVHLRFAEHACRDEESKRSTMENLHKELCGCVGNPPFPVQITTEAIELQPDARRYLKSVREVR